MLIVGCRLLGEAMMVLFAGSSDLLFEAVAPRTGALGAKHVCIEFVLHRCHRRDAANGTAARGSWRSGGSNRVRGRRS